MTPAHRYRLWKGTSIPGRGIVLEADGINRIRRRTKRWDSRKSTLKNDEASLRLQLVGRLGALVDNLGELLLDLLDSHDLSELGEINLLDLEEVEDVGECLESGEVSSDDVLLPLDVVAEEDASSVRGRGD
jgi:hypothetical protein